MDRAILEAVARADVCVCTAARYAAVIVAVVVIIVGMLIAKQHRPP